MRKLDTPSVDDFQALNLLTKRGRHCKKVAEERMKISEAYRLYEQSKGNPWILQNNIEFQEIKSSLHALYNKPPKNFYYIDKLRDSVNGSCPVCGGAAPFTLDHHLPKDIFPQFSLYSRNLVPACSRCNQVKGTKYCGSNYGERGVHPYFDQFAERRVIQVKFSPPWEAPKLEILPFDVSGDDFYAVQWQIKEIIIPAGIEKKIRGFWGQLISNPKKSLRLTKKPANAKKFADLIKKQADVESHMNSSENCWSTVFYHGVADDHNVAHYVWSKV